MTDQFQPLSTDAMFARIIAKQEADTASRDAFRLEMRERFDRGTARMDQQDIVLKSIEEQARKTNGRVTRIEEAELNRRLELLEVAEMAHRTEAARRKGALWVIMGLGGILQAVALAVFSWWLARK